MHFKQVLFLRLPTGKSIVAGWGRNRQIHRLGAGDFQNSGAYTPNLLKVDLPVMNGTHCKETFKIFKSISSEKHLCAGGEEGKKMIKCFILSARSMQVLMSFGFIFPVSHFTNSKPFSV